MRTCTRSRSGNAITGAWARTGSMRTEAIVAGDGCDLLNAELVSAGPRQYPQRTRAAGNGGQATGLLVSLFEEFFIELFCKCE
jgi:hypothetical protein